MNPLQQIADNLAALNSDAPEVADAVIKLTNMAAHPSRGVVDEDARLVRFVGIDPLNIGAGAVMPMMVDSWRFAFTEDANGALRFAFNDAGPLVATAAVLDQRAATLREVGKALAVRDAEITSLQAAALPAVPPEESPLVPVSNADIKAACRHACRLTGTDPDRTWLQGSDEKNWQRIESTVGAALHYYAVGLRNKLWNGKPLTEIAALPAVPDAILRAFSDAAVDAAWAGTGFIRLTATDGEITAECVPASSVTLATPAHDQPEGEG